MKAARQAPAPPKEELHPRIFAAMFGAFLGLSLLKFGNPPIMEKWVDKPSGIYEIVLAFPWPIGWAYTLLALTALLGLSVARWKTKAPKWLVSLPVIWLAWELAATPQAADAALAVAT